MSGFTTAFAFERRLAQTKPRTSLALRDNLAQPLFDERPQSRVFTRSDLPGLVQQRVCKMAHHEEAQIAQQLLSAIPHGTYAACFADPDRDPVWQAMWVNRPPIRDGIFEVSTESGFGLTLDDAMVRKSRICQS